MLESLLSEKGGRKPLRGDLKESSLPEFEAFHKTSFFFGHLLKFSGEQAISIHYYRRKFSKVLNLANFFLWLPN
jgi:hypothetical protein